MSIIWCFVQILRRLIENIDVLHVVLFNVLLYMWLVENIHKWSSVILHLYMWLIENSCFVQTIFCNFLLNKSWDNYSNQLLCCCGNHIYVLKVFQIIQEAISTTFNVFILFQKAIHSDPLAIIIDAVIYSQKWFRHISLLMHVVYEKLIYS